MIDCSTLDLDRSMAPTSSVATLEVFGFGLYTVLRHSPPISGRPNFVRSAIFAAGGYDWCLCFYRADYSYNDDSVSIYLELMTSSAKATAFCEFSIVNPSAHHRLAAVGAVPDAADGVRLR